MPVSVHCPTCEKELLAADDLVGKLASCPHCQSKFPITKGAARSSSGAPATEPRQSVPAAASGSAPLAAPSIPGGSIPVAKPLHLQTAPSMLQAAGDSPAPPPAPPAGTSHPSDATGAPSQPATPKSPPTPAAPPAPHPPASLYPPGKAPAAPKTLATPTADKTKTVRHASAKPTREAQTARFIPADATETRVELGHDGQLPVLRLEESKRVDTSNENVRSSNPWLLVAALIFSFGMSAVMFLVDADRAPSERASKTAARREIEAYYSAPTHPPGRYRQLLRKALQAYNKGDYATERELYRNVLDLLHDENKDPLIGMTGQVDAVEPPHDRHLEELLSTLVDD